MDISDDVAKTLRTLMRGLAQGSNSEIYNSHRELFMLGETVIPVVEEKILSQSWDNIKHGAHLNLLTGLLSLVNDISEVRARQIGETIRYNGCSAVVDSRIRSITEFTLNEFELCPISEIDIYLSKKLENHSRIKKKMTRWLSLVPASDLNEIERVYLIPETDEGHMGTYMPILCSIMVEWNISVSNYNPLSYFFLFQIEATLFHEIGHHVHQHTFGQDPTQEKEADQYAGKLLKKSHPVMNFIVKSYKSIIGKQKVHK